MVRISLTLLFMLGLISESLTCNRYRCSDLFHKVPSGACALIVDSSDYKTLYFKSSACSSSQICDQKPSSPSELTCIDKSDVKSRKLPGEKCDGESEVCILDREECIDGICEGKKLSEECSYIWDCNPGLRCSDSKCLPQLKAFQQGCETETDCQNSLACLKTDTGNTCVPYFSLKEGFEIGEMNCPSDFSTSYLCESGYCGGSNRTCLPTQTSSKLPKKCTQTQDCTSKNSSSIYSMCECGYNENGYAYCAPFLGDKIGIDYIQLLTKWLSSSVNQEHCNTFDRTSLRCAKDWASREDYTNLMYRYISFTFYPYLVGIKSCVRNNLFPDYN